MNFVERHASACPYCNASLLWSPESKRSLRPYISLFPMSSMRLDVGERVCSDGGGPSCTGKKGRSCSHFQLQHSAGRSSNRRFNSSFHVAVSHHCQCTFCALAGWRCWLATANLPIDQASNVALMSRAWSREYVGVQVQRLHPPV